MAIWLTVVHLAAEILAIRDSRFCASTSPSLHGVLSRGGQVAKLGKE